MNLYLFNYIFNRNICFNICDESTRVNKSNNKKLKFTDL